MSKQLLKGVTRMYEEHELNIIAFADIDVFADLSIASDADDDGSGSSYH
ncbi:MAG: hypothetical protein LUF29_07105 [Oscillospiraceae bacterium]|nr:hypothetical protein [Oscillospiraceae bacterium]